MIRELITLAALGVAMESPPLMDDMGVGPPELVLPNRLLDGAGGAVSIVTIREPEGFAEAVRLADAAGVIEAVMPAARVSREQGREAEVFVVFVDDWTAAQGFARGIRSDRLATHYAGVAEKTLVDVFQADMKGGRVVQWITIARKLAPYSVPTACYAQMVVSVVYTAGDPGSFAIRDCAKARR